MVCLGAAGLPGGPGGCRQVVYVVLLGAVARGTLQLNGDVLNAVISLDYLVHTLENLVIGSGIIGGHQDVGRERLAAGGYGPDVDVVDYGNAFNLLQVAAQLVHVYVGGRALQQNVQHRNYQAPGVVHNEQGNEHAEDGVYYHPLKGHNHYCGDNNGNGTQQVCQNVLEGSLHVHAMLGRPVKYPGGGKVHKKSAYTHNEHRKPVYVNFL